jgi:hypothetical protein
MPLIALVCLAGHAAERFLHAAADLGAATWLCPCGETLAPALSVGRGLTYFETGRTFTLRHGVPAPVEIASHGQHRRVLHQHGLEWVADWHTQKSRSRH